jgi:hypothetical protein
VTLRSALAAAATFALAACSTPTTTALWKLAPAEDFYELPFPNDLHRHPDGTLDLSQFPTNSLLLQDVLKDAETLDGFSLNGAMFARFSDIVDPDTFPSPEASMMPGAQIYVVDVDAASPHRGQRVPLLLNLRTDGTQTMGGNRLVARPVPGFPLDEGTTYALVITTRVHDAYGESPVRDKDFDAVMGSGGDAAVVHAREVYAPLLAWLDEPGDDDRSDVVSAAVFTTQHATFVGPALRKGVFATPAPVARNLQLVLDTTYFTLYSADYDAPNFQTGTPPYLESGGEIQVGSDGVAIVQRTETMRLAVMIPKGPVPATGFPLCIYSHGTGGDWMSFFQDGTGERLAQEGIATISTDQVLHGPRNPGGDPSIAFFNFQNPYSIRDNPLQGAADAWSQMRVGQSLAFDDGGMPARQIKIDPDRLYFFGHSQGGLTGPAFIAFEPKLSGAVLSGTGAVAYLSMLYKKAPIDFRQIVETLARDSPMDEDNPSLALAQMWAERADTANYARYMVREPQVVDGVQLAPRNVFHTEGFTDSFAPNPAIEAFATALGGDLVMLKDTKPLLGLTLRGSTIKAPPITDNKNGATVVTAQYKAPQGDDGHFVVFDVGIARVMAIQFLATLAKTGHATVVSVQ